jgi:16S rRNA (cytosine1402-N4)-methyltransferase
MAAVLPEYHTAVMPGEVTANLITKEDGIYLDATAGGGDHAERILENLSAKGKLIGIDRDQEAVDICRRKFAGNKRMQVYKASFSEIEKVCGQQDLSGAFFDLGVSSHQLDSPARGFSFERGNPLDMRMDQSRGITALEYLLHTEERELEKALKRNSDLKRARALARAIKDLAGHDSASDLLHQAADRLYPRGVRNRMGLLARIFQALRMEVNRELEEIRAGLNSAVNLVEPGGRICVLTYHSVEDRLVKKLLAAYEQSCICPREFPVCACGGNHRKLRKISRKPLVSSPEEVRQNARARSAKLRVVERIGN